MPTSPTHRRFPNLPSTTYVSFEFTTTSDKVTVKKETRKNGTITKPSGTTTTRTPNPAAR